MAKALVLLSGGLDSTTVLAIAKRDNQSVEAMAFDYGQRHRRELDAAKSVADYYATQLAVVPVNFRRWGGSALTDNIEVPAYVGGNEIPVTYVPGRNIVFLAMGASYAEAKGLDLLYYGANAIDFSGYPDCRPEFVVAMANALMAGMKNAPRLIAPIISMSKTEIIKAGLALGVPYQLTWSCYRGETLPCGECDSCRLRAEAWRQVGMQDPQCTGAPRSVAHQNG